MFALDDRHRCHLLGRRPELLHVPVRRHRERIGNRNTERHFILLIATFRHRSQCKVGRQTRQQAVAADDQYVLRQAADDRRRRDVEHRGRGRARRL